MRWLDADWRESSEVCADAAWAARAQGNSVLSSLSPSQVTSSDLDPVTARTYRHLYLNALRYDIRCPTLQAFIEQLVDSGVQPLDCYSRALYAFALLAQSHPEGPGLMDELLGEVGAHAKTLHVLLHGLWLGQNLDQGAERILALSSQPPFDGDNDPIVLFRVAGALRRLGRYDEGLTAIDQALDLLPPGDALVVADLVRERLLIVATQDLCRHQLAQPFRGALA
ncbi:hypothetical protein [Streptomyces luteireticuli]|uniref:hypothetical protein n=1 Tax=Streptomyces luteireticuli TaxID=173858 RepID=UPI003557DA27